MKKRLFILLTVLVLTAASLTVLSAFGETRRTTVTIGKEEYDRLKKFERRAGHAGRAGRSLYLLL